MGSMNFAKLRQIHKKLEKPIGKTPRFSQLSMKLKGKKFCTHVPRTCVHKLLVLNFHLFAKLSVN